MTARELKAMKASELIAKLQRYIDLVGDQEVVYGDHITGDFIPIGRVNQGVSTPPNPDPFVDDPADRIVIGRGFQKKSPPPAPKDAKE